MPVNIARDNGLEDLHFAARLQGELPQSENPVDMELEIYFWVQSRLNGINIAPKYWDSNKLVIKIANEPRLLEAVHLIQQIIGERRREQLEVLMLEATEPTN